MEGPILNSPFDYGYSDEALDHFVRGAEIFPEKKKLKTLIYSDINDSETNQKVFR